MKIAFFIPTYWCRPTTVGHKEGDLIFDHPTPVDTEGTLERALRSFLLLSDQDWSLLIGVAVTSQQLCDAAYAQVQNILSKLPQNFRKKILITGDQEGERWRETYLLKDIDAELIKFHGYPGIRNIGLLSAIIQGVDLLVMVDDDQVFEDPKFVTKLRETAAESMNGKPLVAWTGYCPELSGYARVRPFEPWMKYWNKISAQNATYEQLIGVLRPRLKKTPLAFGGCLVLKRELFTILPFDPYVSRGEDMDYLMNAKMFNIDFYLDNQLAMLHLPPSRSHPQWRRVREDLTRFLYQREKIRRQKPHQGMRIVTANDFLPYPGVFLGDDLDQKIKLSNRGLSKLYKKQGDHPGEKEAQKNIAIANTTKYLHDPFLMVLSLQQQWMSITSLIKRHRKELLSSFFVPPK